MKKIIFLLSLVSASMLSAMYCPYEGRFLSRDPINEPGFKTTAQATGNVRLLNALVNKKFEPEYTFVKNNPANKWDYLGLACCNGSTYDSDKQCCKDGNVKSLVKVCIRSTNGHSWIYANDLSTGTAHTYGNWMKGERSVGKVKNDGFNVDLELNSPYEKTPQYVERCSNVCDYQPTAWKDYGLKRRNCASYACSEWNKNTNEDINPDTGLGYDHPEAVYVSIQDANVFIATVSLNYEYR